MRLLSPARTCVTNGLSTAGVARLPDVGKNIREIGAPGCGAARPSDSVSDEGTRRPLPAIVTVVDVRVWVAWTFSISVALATVVVSDAAGRRAAGGAAPSIGAAAARRVGLQIQADDVARAAHRVGRGRGEGDADARQIPAVDGGRLLQRDAGERAAAA